MKTSTKKSLQMLFIACLCMVILWWLGEQEFIEKASDSVITAISMIALVTTLSSFILMNLLRKH